YAKNPFNTELYCMFNGWKRIKNYYLFGEDNVQYATPDGMPGWFTLNWKAGYALSNHLQLQLAVENILDKNYRYFASGFSAAGRNFVVALRVGF
nr:TonB-dependent receptor [Chitinophagaceae bacterium]